DPDARELQNTAHWVWLWGGQHHAAAGLCCRCHPLGRRRIERRATRESALHAPRSQRRNSAASGLRRRRRGMLAVSEGDGRCFGNGLKRIPGRSRREFKVADVIAEPNPEAGSDRHNDYIFISRGKRRHAKTCHHISGTSDSIKLFVDRVSARKVVHQHHGPRAVGPYINADCWPLPENPQGGAVLGVKSTVAVSQTADECTTCFLAKYVTVRFAPSVCGFLDDRSDAFGYTTKEVMTGIKNFAGGVLIWR